MKKLSLKIMAVALISALALSFGGCKETIDGSVVRRADFNVTYTVGGETQTVESTLTLYETFAPETTGRVISLIEGGYYNDTVLTLSKSQDYLVVGGFTEGYEVKSYEGSAVKGEFTNNGLRSELTVKAGALVMLRDFDIDAGDAKYDTAKATFAIVLTDSGVFHASEFCVFGYIDNDSLTSLKEVLVDNAKDENGYLRMNYVGKRVDGVQSYQDGFEYFLNEDNEYFKQVGAEKVEMEYATEDDVDYATVEIIKDGDNAQDIFVLPATTFKVCAEMRGKSGCSKK